MPEEETPKKEPVLPPPATTLTPVQGSAEPPPKPKRVRRKPEPLPAAGKLAHIVVKNKLRQSISFNHGTQHVVMQSKSEAILLPPVSDELKRVASRGIVSYVEHR